MRKLTAVLLRHRLLIAVAWIALTVVGGVFVGKANNGLNHKIATPGLAGYDANIAMIHRLNLDGAEAPVIAVMQLPAGKSMLSASGRALAAATFATAAEKVKHVGLIDYATSHNARLVSKDGAMTWAVFDVPNPDVGVYKNAEGSLKPVLAKLTPSGAHITVTGNEALQSSSSGGAGLSTLTETLIGAAAALGVLAVLYGSAIAVVPILMALPSILISFLMLYGLEQLISVSSLEQYLVAFIGLGVAIDYSLLIVTRWREERERGLDNRAAIIAANEHAGRAVLLSGCTVGLGLVALLVIPVQFLQDIGIGSLLIPLASMAVTVTLLPVVLSAWGPALDRHRIHRSSTTYSRFWERWATTIVNRRWLAAVAGLAVVIALAVPALSINTGDPNASSLGGHTPAARAWHQLEAGGMPQAANFPIQLLVHGDAKTVRTVAATVARVSGVWQVFIPRTPSNTTSGYAMVTAIPTQPDSSSVGEATVTRVRAAVAKLPVRVGGETAANMDFTNAIYTKFPLALALIALITFVLLARSFRSVPLALKAVVLNLISLGAAFGFVVMFWQSGIGSNLIYGVQATHAIRNWAPIIVFAFLFGISMDYEVFVLSRMREEYDRTGDTRRAIIASMSRTGRLITGAALILAISFASLSMTPDIAVQVPATGLAFGVVVDAVIVRTLLVPAIASLLGDWNWWMPDGLARILRAPTPSALASESAPARAPAAAVAADQ